MHKQLAIHHKDFLGKCLNSKTYKGRAIMDGEANIVMNKSSEFSQPAVQRVAITRTLVDTTDSTLHSATSVCVCPQGRARSS